MKIRQGQQQFLTCAVSQADLRRCASSCLESPTPNSPAPAQRGDPFVATAVQVLKFLVELTKIRRKILTEEVSPTMRTLLLRQTDALIARVVADAGRITPKLRKPAKESKKHSRKFRTFGALSFIYAEERDCHSFALKNFL